MRPSHSLDRIYGEAQTLALHNRVRFIKGRHANMRVPVGVMQRREAGDKENAQEGGKAEVRDNYVGILLVTDHELERKKAQRQVSQKVLGLKELKSQRYREAKDNSERFKAKISQRRDKELMLKRIRRREVLDGQEKCRTALHNFEQYKLTSIRETKTNQEYANDRLQWKRIQLKRQLVQEQTRSLHVYEKSLSYKTELMHKIKDLLSSKA